MYDVANFQPPVAKQYDRSPEPTDVCDTFEALRYERSRSFVADLIRERFNEQKVQGLQRQ